MLARLQFQLSAIEGYLVLIPPTDRLFVRGVYLRCMAAVGTATIHLHWKFSNIPNVPQGLELPLSLDRAGPDLIRPNHA